MKANQILRYVVRRPGFACWSRHISELAAHREKAVANQLVRGHKVFAEHQNGDVTGPYEVSKG